MSNVTLRSHTRLRSLALFTSSALVAFACSSNDANPGGGAGAKGTPNAGTSSVAGTGGKGGAGGITSSGTGGTGGSAGTASGSGGSSAGSGATAGSPASGGRPAMAGSGGVATAGAPNGGTPAGGASGGVAGGMAGATSGGAGAATAGAGGGAVGGMGGGAGSSGGSTKDYTCNLVLGIDSTSEWFTGGFENQVPNDKWELIYYHPGYVEDWADPNDHVWTVAPTSPCTMNSTNPERVIFNMFADTADTSFTNKAAWQTGIQKVVANLKAKYSRLKRIDLLTMTRGPNNMACVSTNRSGSVVEQYTDDAVAASLMAGPPAVVSSGSFFAPDCTVFQDGGPHFTDAGKPIIAKLYGDHYLAEP